MSIPAFFHRLTWNNATWADFSVAPVSRLRLLSLLYIVFLSVRQGPYAARRGVLRPRRADLRSSRCAHRFPATLR